MVLCVELLKVLRPEALREDGILDSAELKHSTPKYFATKNRIVGRQAAISPIPDSIILQ